MMKEILHNARVGSHFHWAFVIKNKIPYGHKVLLLHQTYGKIWCNFSKFSSARLLTTGSIISCLLEKTTFGFQFVDLEIQSQIHPKDLIFVHELMRVCLHAIEYHVPVAELFDFLCFVYHHLHELEQKNRDIVLLRLFLMCDLLPESPQGYSIATCDPLTPVPCDEGFLHQQIAKCWDNFEKSHKKS
jgi:hypothetical protein